MRSKLSNLLQGFLFLGLAVWHILASRRVDGLVILWVLLGSLALYRLRPVKPEASLSLKQ